jgi:hypothetical protein
VRARGVVVGWVAVAIVLLVGLAWELHEWRSIDARRDRAAAERTELEGRIAAHEEEIRREERAHSDLLRDLQWSSNRGDPSAFLTGLADFARGARLKITAIGPLEREAATQFHKSWHAVQVVGPFREVKDLATRIEQEGGILDDLSIQTTASGGPLKPTDEVHARWNLAVVELTPSAKAIIQRTVRVDGQGAASLALPLPLATAVAGRDPFAFVAAPSVPRPPVVTAPPPPSVRSARPSPAADGGTFDPAPTALTVKGIVKFPGGHLAIVNNQIVQVGDVVEGHRVEQISDASVVVRPPQGAPRPLALPALTTSTPAAPRR